MGNSTKISLQAALQQNWEQLGEAFTSAYKDPEDAARKMLLQQNQVRTVEYWLYFARNAHALLEKARVADSGGTIGSKPGMGPAISATSPPASHVPARQNIDPSRFDPSLAPLIARLNDPNDKEVLFINGRAVLFIESQKNIFFEDKGKIKKIDLDSKSPTTYAQSADIYKDFKRALEQPDKKLDGYNLHSLTKSRLKMLSVLIMEGELQNDVYDLVYIGPIKTPRYAVLLWLKKIEKEAGNDVYIYAKYQEQETPKILPAVTTDPVQNEVPPVSQADPIQFLIGDPTKSQKGTILFCNETPNLLAVIYNNSEGQKRFIVLSRERDGELFSEVESLSEKKPHKRILKDPTFVTKLLEERSINADELADGITINNKQNGKSVTFIKNEDGSVTATVSRPDLRAPLEFNFSLDPASDSNAIEGIEDVEAENETIIFSKEWFDELPTDDPQVRFIRGKKYFYLDMNNYNGIFFITLNKSGALVLQGENAQTFPETENEHRVIDFLKAIRANDQKLMDEFADFGSSSDWMPFMEGRYGNGLKKLKPNVQSKNTAAILSFKNSMMSLSFYKEGNLYIKYTAPIPDVYLKGALPVKKHSEEVSQQNTPITKEAFEHYMATSQNGDVLQIANHPFIILPKGTVDRMALLTLAPNGEVVFAHVNVDIKEVDNWSNIAIDTVSLATTFIKTIKDALSKGEKSLWNHESIVWQYHERFGHVFNVEGGTVALPIKPLIKDSPYHRIPKKHKNSTLTILDNQLILFTVTKHKYQYPIPEELLGEAGPNITQPFQEVYDIESDENPENPFAAPTLKPEDLPLLEHETNPFEFIEAVLIKLSQVRPSLDFIKLDRLSNKAELGKPTNATQKPVSLGVQVSVNSDINKKLKTFEAWVHSREAGNVWIQIGESQQKLKFEVVRDDQNQIILKSVGAPENWGEIKLEVSRDEKKLVFIQPNKLQQWLESALYGPTITMKNIVDGDNAKLIIEVVGVDLRVGPQIIEKIVGAGFPRPEFDLDNDDTVRAQRAVPQQWDITYTSSQIPQIATLIDQITQIYEESVAQKRNPVWNFGPVKTPVGAGSPRPEIDSTPETNPPVGVIHESPKQNDASITGGDVARNVLAAAIAGRDITGGVTPPLQPEPIIRNESVKTHIVRGEKEILQDPFELTLTTIEDPLTHAKKITGARLELKIDQILQGALDFDSKDLLLNLGNISISFNSKITLAFTHPTLGEISYQIYTDANGTSRAIRFPLEKIWEIERQEGKYLLQGMGGENHAVEFLMTHPSQRRSPHGFYRENLFVLDTAAIPAFLIWCQIIGDPVEFKEGEHTGVALVTPAERKKDGVTIFQVESGRFVAFKQNADGSFPLISLWLTDDEKQAVERAREKTEPLQGASSTVVVDVDEAPQVFSPLPKMGVEAGDVFLPTEETLDWIQKQFLSIPPHTRSPFALGQSLKQNLEFETASGLVISIPVIWMGRPRNPFKLDTKGSFVTNTRGEIQYDAKGHPLIKGNRISTYIKGHKNSTLKYVDYSFWSYDQGGFWNLYVMTPVDQLHVKPFNLRLAFSKQSPLFFALFNTLNEKHNEDDEALYQKSAVSELHDLLQRHIRGNQTHSPALYLRRKKVEIQNGKPIALRFVSPDDLTEYKAELTGFRLKGLKFNDQADRLDFDPYLTLSITSKGKEPEILKLQHSRTAEPHVISLTQLPNPGESFNPDKHGSFYWHLKTGILTQKTNGKSVAFDEKAFLKWLEVNHLLSRDWQVDFGEPDPAMPQGSFHFKEGSSVGFDFPLSDIPEMPLVHQGFALPAAALVDRVSDAAQIEEILQGISLHDQVFVPVEESLFAQTLIGRDTEVMRFISRDGLILQIPMKSTPEGKSYVADLDPNSIFRIAGTRLLIPNKSPDNNGRYYDLKTAVLHERRLSGGDRSMELEVQGTNKHHFELHQFTTSQTFSGKTAFAYHAKQRGREWKVTSANAARVLRSWIEYLKLDALSKPDRLSMDLKLSDLQIAKRDNRHFMVMGLKKGVGSQGEPEVRLDYIDHTTDQKKYFKVYRASDESALFYLYEPQLKKYFNFVISSEGQLWIWERKALIGKFLNPDSSVGFDMNKIIPTLVKENYAGDAKSRATRVTVSEENDPLKHFEITAILGRWEGASDLDFTADKGGKLARVRFHVLVDETGKLELFSGTPNEMEKESGAYFPWDDKSKWQITEDEWIDKNGTTHRGAVRINVINPEGKNETGKDIQPYAYLEFKNREALVGENFEVSKAHYNKDGARNKKIMPGDPGYLCNRGGVVPAMGYFGVKDFLKLGAAGKAMLEQLLLTQARQSDFPLLMSALEFLDGGLVKPDHSADEADVIEMAHFGNELTEDDLITTDDELNPQPEASEIAQPPGIGLLSFGTIGLTGGPINPLSSALK